MPGHAVSTKESPVPSGHYSQAIIANGFVFVAGVGPYDPLTRAIIGDTIEEQTAQTLANIAATLKVAGCGLGDVINSTVWLAHLERDWAGFDSAFGEFFSPPYPARAAVGAELKRILVEIAVVAALPR